MTNVMETMAAAAPQADRVDALATTERRLLWLPEAMIDHANRLRPNPSGLKVAVTRHQAHRWSRS